MLNPLLSNLLSNVMLDSFAATIANFTIPENIGTEATALLWVLPLAAAIAVTYKATKLPSIKALDFIKESAILFGSIVVFIVTSALVLYTTAWLISR
ncbi:MAG: hypothetical protein ACYSWP_03925 [Planctomycetota bacterium]|jgi:hypothetical protein